jgi:hypothetical protein
MDKSIINIEVNLIKKYLYLAIIILIASNLKSQPSNHAAYFGDCDTSDTEQHFRLVAYPFTAYDSLFKYSSISPCGSEYPEIENRKLIREFDKFIFNNQEYKLSDLEIFMTYQQYDSVLALNEFVFELRNSADSVVAIDFASKVFHSTLPTDSTYKYYKSFFMQVDYVDVNGSTYSRTDTTEVNIYFNSSTDYLKKIIDIDRSKIVGLKYYSTANNEEYIYFFEPNN